MKKFLLTSFVAGLLFVGGGCTPNRQTDLNSVSTTPVAAVTPTTNTTTTDVIPTSTPSLIDKPISKWPRYEFKELNFSIQLPYKKDRVSYGFHDCLQREDRCDGLSMYWYGSSIRGEDGNWHSFAGTHSENFSYGRESSITDIANFIPGKNPKLVFPGYETARGIEIQKLQYFSVQGQSVYTFDIYKNFYAVSGLEPFEEVGAVFKLPFNNKFKAVVLEFKPEIIPAKLIPTIIKTIRFSSKDYFANEEKKWPRYTFKELGFSLQLPFPTSSILSSEYRCDQDVEPKEAACSSDSNYKKYTSSFNLPNATYDFLTAVSGNAWIYGTWEPFSAQRIFTSGSTYYLGEPDDVEPDIEIIPLATIKSKHNVKIFLIDYSTTIKTESYEQPKIALLIPLNKGGYELATVTFNKNDMTTTSLKRVAESLQWYP